MRLNKLTLQDVVRWRMCTGCGACVFACPPGSVTLEDVPEQGLRPVFKHGCGESEEFTDICPGACTTADLIEETNTNVGSHDPFLGSFIEHWEGWAADPSVRMQGSSGGLLTALSLYCIEHGGMTGVLHSGMDPDIPWRNRTVLSRSRGDILLNAGSRYSPAAPCVGLEMVRDAEHPCAFVGKPTDASAVQLLRNADQELNRKLGVVMSFFCAGTPSTQGTLYLLNKLDIDTGKVTSLSYRGKGWPGGFEVITIGGQRSFIPYEEAWSSLAHFKPIRENLEPDSFGRNADISCGDAWHLEDRDGNPGVSVVLVRTELGRSIVHAAEQSGYVVLRPTSVGRILAGQINLVNKQRELYGRQLAFRAFNIPQTTFHGFSLRSCWRQLPLGKRIKTFLGTIRRILTRKLWRASRQ